MQVGGVVGIASGVAQIGGGAIQGFGGDWDTGRHNMLSGAFGLGTGYIVGRGFRPKGGRYPSANQRRSNANWGNAGTIIGGVFDLVSQLSEGPKMASCKD